MPSLSPKSKGKCEALCMDKENVGLLVDRRRDKGVALTKMSLQGDRSIGLSARALGNQYARKIDAVSEHGASLSSAETSCLSVLCSPRLSSKKDGPRVDTDITIEDIGYFMSPGERSYDAIGLMKQLGEQTAGAFADAQKVLGDETPETLVKAKFSTNQEVEKENNCSPNSQTEHRSISASNFMAERRALDFSECGTPAKETGKFGSSIGFSSPSSYLLKSCR
ncbi:Transcription factor R-4 [Sesamum angolense]|uniref:Transcription factor R-4 n=1 Tax=Sesamum angolense TaxID=2727404 RepID=A0AAE1W8Q9_9LAMI|nr:Transcription factor R-4 [Sesamum angolense]